MMQSLEQRAAMPVSYVDMEQEDSLGHQQLLKNGLSRQNEILRLPHIPSLVNSSHVCNNSLQKELFSFKMRNCTLFKAVPLPHIGKRIPPHLVKTASGAASSKEPLALLFSPEKDAFEKMFHHFDSAAVTGWLERARGHMNDMGAWSCRGDNFVRFAHFWLTEFQENQKRQLLELEMAVIGNEVYLAFLDRADPQECHSSDLNSILAAVLSEYPMGLVNNQNPYIFLDYLNLMSSVNTSGYKQMLSSVQYTTKSPQIAQWLLAIRVFALANLWHAIVKVKINHNSSRVLEELVAKFRVESFKTH